MTTMEDNRRTETVTGTNREVDAAEVFVALWKSRFVLLGSVVLFALLGVISLHFATYLYTAELTVYPTQQSSGIGQQIGGLASLAGINIPKGETSSFEIYSQELYSRELADNLSDDQYLMRSIFRVDWDPKTSRWKEPRSLLSDIKKVIKATLGFPIFPWKSPGGAELQAYIVDTVRYEEIPKKTSVTLSYDNKDPKFAIYFLGRLHHAADEQVRHNMLRRVTQYISYLNKKIQSQITQENKTALISILSDQEELSMTASSDVAFAAESLGAASASPAPTKPSPIAILMIYVVVGLLVGVAISLFRLFVGENISNAIRRNLRGGGMTWSAARERHHREANAS